MMELFLSASFSDNRQRLLLSPSSKCVLLVTLYPQSLTGRTRLTFVLPPGCEACPDGIDLVLFLGLGFAAVRVLAAHQLDVELRLGAMPPLLRCSDRRLVWVGLPSIVRALVGISATKGNTEALGLLGLHKACLKACKEVSKWTMFCEQSLPCALARAVAMPAETPSMDVIQQMRQAFHLQAPIHNRSKRLRDIRRQEKWRKEKEEQRMAQAALAENSDPMVVSPTRAESMEFHRKLPGTHRFLEGVRKTLVDVLAFFYIHEGCRDSAAVKAQVDQVAELCQWQFCLGKDAALQQALQDIDAVPLRWADALEKVVDDADDTFSSIVQGIDKMKVSAEPDGVTVEALSSSLAGLEWSVSACHDCLAGQWDALPESVHPRDGEVPASRLQRKCQQLGSIISAVLPLARPGDTIVDFCSGAGHVGLVLASLLPKCQVILLENKEESLVRAEERIGRAAGQLDNVYLYKCNLTDFRSTHFRVGVALHACGSATDLVMDACASAGAHFVVSPCCYGAIKPNGVVGRFPRSRAFRDVGCTEASYARLRHYADSWKEDAGRQSMILVDSDRLWRAKERDRFTSVRLLQMSPADCSPKNLILVGQAKWTN